MNNVGPLYASTTVVDPEGNLVNGSNRRGTKTSFKDVDDRIVAVIEYNNGIPVTTTYEYDPLGQIIHVLDNKNNLTTVDYDEQGHRTAIDNPTPARPYTTTTPTATLSASSWRTPIISLTTTSLTG